MSTWETDDTAEERAGVHADDEGFEDDTPMTASEPRYCCNESDGELPYLCTLPEHHSGDFHVAHGSDGGMLYRWPVAAPLPEELPAESVFPIDAKCPGCGAFLRITPVPGVPGTGAENLAASFHAAYERLAPSFGYETRKASAKPWKDVPENNRRLMTAVCAEILASLSSQLERLRAEQITAEEAKALLDGMLEEDLADQAAYEAYTRGFIKLRRLSQSPQPTEEL